MAADGASRVPVAGSRTPYASGSAKMSHHRPTMTNDAFTACAVSASPNHAGRRVIATLIENSNPPPRYPNAYPNPDTRSYSRGSATWSSSESLNTMPAQNPSEPAR